MRRKQANSIKQNKTITGENGSRSAMPLPRIACDAISYFVKEEAKISSAGVMKGGLLFVTIGVAMFPDAAMTAHENLHMNINSHSNRPNESFHVNLSPINLHNNANVHTNFPATAAHSNINVHSSTAAVNVHSNINTHASTAAVNTHASKPAISVANVHASQSVVKGSVHNSGAQGKHTAWKGHANTGVSVHTNTAAATTHNNVGPSSAHSNMNAHANSSVLNTHTNHNNSVDLPAINRHASVQTHANAIASNAHVNVAPVNLHSSSNNHHSHDSHSSW